jgi:hypothetical protein
MSLFNEISSLPSYIAISLASTIACDDRNIASNAAPPLYMDICLAVKVYETRIEALRDK